MGRIVVTEYISVDGVVEAPSGTETFERVGWTDDFSRGPEGDAFKFEETMASDALLLGDVVGEVTKLKQQYERDIVVHGSPQLTQTLIEHDLVDELRLLVYPVIV